MVCLHYTILTHRSPHYSAPRMLLLYQGERWKRCKNVTSRHSRYKQLKLGVLITVKSHSLIGACVTWANTLPMCRIDLKVDRSSHSVLKGHCWMIEAVRNPQHVWILASQMHSGFQSSDDKGQGILWTCCASVFRSGAEVPSGPSCLPTGVLRIETDFVYLLSAGLNVGCFYAVSTLLNRMIIEHYPVSLSAGEHTFLSSPSFISNLINMLNYFTFYASLFARTHSLTPYPQTKWAKHVLYICLTPSVTSS